MNLKHLNSKQKLTAQIQQSGFEVLNIEDLSAEVLAGFAAHIEQQENASTVSLD